MTALWIILGIIAFFVVLFSVRVTVFMTYDDIFKLDIQWLFVKLHILPKKEKPEKEKEPEQKEEENPKEEPKEKPEKKDNIIVNFYHNQGFNGVLTLLRDTVAAINGMFGSIFRHIIFRELKLYLSVGAGDAAETAILYGKVCSMVFPAMGLITSTCKVKEYDCGVQPNFMSSDKYAVFRAVISFRPIFLTNAVVVLGVKLLFKVLFKLLKYGKPAAETADSQPKAAENNNTNNTQGGK